jgi:hypothetical protein
MPIAVHKSLRSIGLSCRWPASHLWMYDWGFPMRLATVRWLRPAACRASRSLVISNRYSSLWTDSVMVPHPNKG